jgi:hypothetical protein
MEEGVCFGPGTLGENTPSHIGAAAGGCCKLFQRANGCMDGRGIYVLWILRVANASPSLLPPNALIKKYSNFIQFSVYSNFALFSSSVLQKR